MDRGALNRKSLVIIGGTTGLGLSAARAFIAEGARVIVVGRRQESADQAQQQLGDRARTLIWEASDPECAPQAIQKALNDHGAFHGLYHVAGGSGRAAGD